jgi:hypothetical protein
MSYVIVLAMGLIEKLTQHQCMYRSAIGIEVSPDS